MNGNYHVYSNSQRKPPGEQEIKEKKSLIDNLDFSLKIFSLVCFRKVVDHPKRRFGIPVDRIGGNRLSNSRG